MGEEEAEEENDNDDMEVESDKEDGALALRIATLGILREKKV